MIVHFHIICVHIKEGRGTAFVCWNFCKVGTMFSCVLKLQQLSFFFSALSMIGLVLIALGTGGIKPCVAAFGGDQFDESQVYFYISDISFLLSFYKSVVAIIHPWLYYINQLNSMCFYCRINRGAGSSPSFICQLMLEVFCLPLSLPYWEVSFLV